MRHIWHHHSNRAVGALALALGLALTLTACGEDSAETTPAVSTTQHNQSDVEFATDMIQHHAQALSMVDLTRGRTLDPRIEELAEGILESQGAEVQTMSGWLLDWDEDIPETMRDHSNAGHDGGDPAESMEGMDVDMPGMMSAEEMTALAGASDADFPQLWLEMMIEHHTGAIEMAESEQAEGQYQEAVELAAAVVESQTAEIATMEALLGS